MELSHSLLLNEEALAQMPEQKKPVFVYEWLRFLDRVLPVAQKSDIKGCQQKLVEQLTNQILAGAGPATRKLLARCLATLFSVGDTFSLFQAINVCNDLIKNKDDSPSVLPSKLAAICCLGAMYEKLGRMVGRSFEETTQILIKSLKNAEVLVKRGKSHGRIETMLTLDKMVTGLGTAGASVRKEIYKAARLLLTDRVMSVRCAAATCMESLTKESQFIFTHELENVCAACFKSFEGSNYDVRCSVARLLGLLMAASHNPKLSALSKTTAAPGGGVMVQSASGSSIGAAVKPLTLEECWAIIASGFLRGGLGFFRGGAGVAGNIPKDVRIGVTMGYVEFVNFLGPAWLERNANVVMRHFLDLAASAGKSGSNLTHTDVLYLRNCVRFIIRQTFGKILNEKAQITTCKELGIIIAEHMNTIDLSMDVSLDRSISPELSASQQLAVVALVELAHLVALVGSAVAPLFVEASGIMEPVFAVLLHPCLPCRMASAWCLRCVATSVPSLLTPLVDRCLNRLEHQKTSPDAISGYALCLASLLSTVHQCPLGIPHSKGKQIFAAAEELLRTASQSSRLTLVKTQAGWLLLSALSSLGPPVVKHHLPKLILLWKNAFPRTSKEAESEKLRGDIFTWQVTLESRAGALASIQYFLAYCKELVTDDVVRRIMAPIDTALTMLSILPQVIKQVGHQLKGPSMYVRYRLYKTLLQWNPKQFEGSFAPLLRELVAEFTLTDNPTVVCCTVTQQLCHLESISILGVCFRDSNHKMIEDEIVPANHNHAPALENDMYILCCRDSQDDLSLPVPLAVVDHSILLYGSMFPHVPTKHRLQMLDHFNECIKQAKGVRQQAIQMNVLTALLSSLKALSDNKTMLENELVIKSALNLILAPLAHSNSMLRCAAAEALGRAAQVVSEARFVAEMAQYCFDKLKTCRDVVSRTGHSLALGCLHRYVGGLGSGQHLNTSIGVLLALAQDFSSPVVQVWSLHALGLIAASGGPMFRSYVEPALSLCLKILLTVPASADDVCQCVGKLMGSLIITVGPELQNNIGGIVTTRNSFLAACAVMTEHPDPTVRAEAISCTQQIHLFAPRHVNLSILVPELCMSLKSEHIVLRKASVSCLRQLVQREAKEVREHAQNLVPQGLHDKKTALLPETGLEGALFALMDTETDQLLINNIKETLVSLAQCLSNEQLTHWLMMCKDILAATATDVLSPVQEEKIVRSASGIVSDADGGDEQREEDTIKVGTLDEDQFSRMVPRYQTRVFAVEIVRKIICLCENERAHFDLALAKELQLSGGKNFLVLHLSDLIRMSFMAATSNNIDSRLAGLACLQDVITNFAKVPEPEFPGHVILEQFQAQVGAALRPAFTPETPSHVTAAACQVCSTWIGSGVARDLNDLRRVHQLLASSLAKLKVGSISTQLYNESAATLEKLSILKAWAEVYIVAMKQDAELKSKKLNRKSSGAGADSAEDTDDAPDDLCQSESLLQLVTPELASLIDGWLSALRDYALLTLPAEFSSQLPPDGGAYFTPESADSVRSYYKNSWPPILLATSTWLKTNDFNLPVDSDQLESSSSSAKFAEESRQKTPVKLLEESKEDKFSLILGTCMEALCSPRSVENTDTVNLCLESLKTILECEWAQLQLTSDSQLIVEVLNVMHRLILTRENLSTQILCMDVVNNVLQACESSIRLVNDTESDEGVEPDPNVNPRLPANQFRGQEGGEGGKLEAGKSVVYAVLEVCLCQMVRQVPQINPATAKSKSGVMSHRKYGRFTSPEGQQLLTMALKCLVRLPALCSNKGTLTVLPTVFFLILGVLRETSKIDKNHFGTQSLATGVVSLPAAAALQSFRSLVSKPLLLNESPDPHWTRIVQCALWSTLDLVDANNEDSYVDKTVVILATAIFVVAAPSQVVTVTNLQQSCVDLFKRCLQDENYVVQQKCLQTLQSIFAVKAAAVCVPFIQSLTPLIVGKFKEFVPELSPTSDERRIPDEKNELPILLDAEKALECVLAAALKEKRLSLLALIVQILMSFICDSLSSTTNQIFKQLHDYALSRLNKLGPAYPDEFKTLLARLPSVKLRLENAVRASQQQQNALKLAAASSGKGKNSSTLNSSSSAQPAIKLTMDFSSFVKE